MSKTKDLMIDRMNEEKGEDENPPSDLVCPFCGDDNFDKIGLKYHLRNHCDEYDKTENP